MEDKSGGWDTCRHRLSSLYKDRRRVLTSPAPIPEGGQSTVSPTRPQYKSELDQSLTIVSRGVANTDPTELVEGYLFAANALAINQRAWSELNAQTGEGDQLLDALVFDAASESVDAAIRWDLSTLLSDHVDAIRSKDYLRLAQASCRLHRYVRQGVGNRALSLPTDDNETSVEAVVEECLERLASNANHLKQAVRGMVPCKEWLFYPTDEPGSPGSPTRRRSLLSEMHAQRQVDNIRVDSRVFVGKSTPQVIDIHSETPLHIRGTSVSTADDSMHNSITGPFFTQAPTRSSSLSAASFLPNEEQRQHLLQWLEDFDHMMHDTLCHQELLPMSERIHLARRGTQLLSKLYEVFSEPAPRSSSVDKDEVSKLRQALVAATAEVDSLSRSHLPGPEPPKQVSTTRHQTHRSTITDEVHKPPTTVPGQVGTHQYDSELQSIHELEAHPSTHQDSKSKLAEIKKHLESGNCAGLARLARLAMKQADELGIAIQLSERATISDRERHNKRISDALLNVDRLQAERDEAVAKAERAMLQATSDRNANSRAKANESAALKQYAAQASKYKGIGGSVAAALQAGDIQALAQVACDLLGHVEATAKKPTSTVGCSADFQLEDDMDNDLDWDVLAIGKQKIIALRKKLAQVQRERDEFKELCEEYRRTTGVVDSHATIAEELRREVAALEALSTAQREEVQRGRAKIERMMQESASEEKDAAESRRKLNESWSQRLEAAMSDAERALTQRDATISSLEARVRELEEDFQ